MSKRMFFDASREPSLIKAEIVAKYFWAWAKVVLPTAKRRNRNIAYVDLFAGPGRYKDGEPSTPMLVLKRAVEDAEIRERLVTMFNDRDEAHVQSLQEEIERLPDLHLLKHRPQVFKGEVGDRIVTVFEETRLVPTLCFVDPWGYKGLSLRLLGSILKDWGCDCIFFFNYNRINMGLSNPYVLGHMHMDALFGDQRTEALRVRLQSMLPAEREITIVSELTSALRELGGKYVVPFRFKDEQGKRTIHHLILVTKHARGYHIMESVMAGYSSSRDQGVPSFEYNPAEESSPRLFPMTRPLDELVDTLLSEFAGRTLRMKEVHEQHVYEQPYGGKRYIKKNYKDALLKLEAEGRISASPPAEDRRRLTLGDKVRVTFPAR